MGRRSRRRAQDQTTAATTEYIDDAGSLLILRDRLSPGTLRQLDSLHASAAASRDDIAQRRAEFLFERLAVRWTIADLPLEDQRALLGRYRMADAGTRAWVRETLDKHLRARHPEAST